ncbi:MAG TPA: DNA-directed RNA polymerase subunit omega [Candidatus Choladousia intestinipullorum]|nr:DNA-directed RNA polymerase subunit omega [Candidatus Choladousia intestinipullorum]
MLHPSYSDLMQVVNSGVEEGDEPVVSSRYSIVLATAKRARQIIARQSRDDLDIPVVSKPLSKAVAELNEGKIKILPEEDETIQEETE